MDITKYGRALVIILVIYMPNCQAYNFSGHTDYIADFVLPFYTRYCPFTDLCTQNASQTALFHQDLCCSACTCDEYCAERGNCCPDANPDIQINRRVVTQCTANIYPPVRVNDDNIETYYTIMTCPNTSKDTAAIDNCFFNGNTFKHLILVSDEHGNIYKNQFCAICNGVTNFETWEMQLECTRTLVLENQLDAISPLHLLSSGCLFWSSKPDHIKAHRCYNPKYTSCNVTGKAGDFSEDIERTCNDLSGPSYLESVNRRYVAYKNLFCYICNTAKENVTNESCDIITHRRTVTDSKMSFAGILAGTSLVELEGSSKQEQLSCPRQEIFDRIEKTCKRLHCPVGQLALNEKCERHVLFSSGLALMFTILVSPTEPFIPIASMFIPRMEEVKAVLHAVQNETILLWSVCGKCSTLVYYYKDKPGLHLVIKIVVFTVSECSITEALNTIKILRNNTTAIRVQFDHLTIPFTFKLIFDYDPSGKVLFGALGISPKCENPIRIEPNFDCPNINVQIKHFVKLMAARGKTIKDDDYRYGYINHVTNDKQMVPVCLHDYFQNAAHSLNLGLYFVLLASFTSTVESL